MSKFVNNKPSSDEDNRISKIAEGERRERTHQLVKAIADHLRRSSCSVFESTGKRPSPREEKSCLRLYISENKLWVLNMSLTNPFGEGGEHKVYLTSDEKHVIKTNDCTAYNYHWEDYLYSILLHNYFFQDTYYEFLGFIEEDGELLSVVKQIFIKQSKHEQSNLADIQKDVAKLGFIKIDDYAYYIPNFRPNIRITLRDVRERNVLLSNGILYYIDTVFTVHGNGKDLFHKGGEILNNETDIFEILFGFKL